MTLLRRAAPQNPVDAHMEALRARHRSVADSAADAVLRQREAQAVLDAAIERMNEAEERTKTAAKEADIQNRLGETARSEDAARAANLYAGQLVAAEKHVESLRAVVGKLATLASQAKDAVSSTHQTILQIQAELDSVEAQERLSGAEWNPVDLSTDVDALRALAYGRAEALKAESVALDADAVGL